MVYDELTEKRTRLKAALKTPKYDMTDKEESEVAPDPYTRIADLEEKMLEAANSGDMALYSTMRAEKKELVRQHGRKPMVVTGTTAAEIQERRRLQAEQDHTNRQMLEDEKANPRERSFESEGDIEHQMTAAAERGDHIEYGRLRRERLKQKRA